VTEGLVLGSVVIPAYNEANVISRCLNALLAGFGPGELDVVVACNGCTDDTAGMARSAGHPIRVLEIAASSKPAALRAADAALTDFPRLYLDADVVISSDSARRVLAALRSGPALAARPPIAYDADGSAALVRRYFRARSRVPAVMGSLWGAGVYGLSADGRARFAQYPDVVADDLFVDQQFSREEIEIVDADPVIVTVPRRTRDLVRILRRTYQGNAEHRELDASAAASAAVTSSAVRDLARLALTRPGRAIDAVTYAALAAFARLTLAVAAPTTWERDSSSRTPRPDTGGI
jgi:glycosyltransferase involved in cell wall biosynthesis